jgi:competence protein ComEA
MRDRLFYWMKFYLGFSGKEARGIVVLIPFLIAFGLTPTILKAVKNKNAEQAFFAHQGRLDSLENLQVQFAISPLPTFNPQDTVPLTRNQKQAVELNRLPFSEADSVLLQIVPGIGPGTAGRIIKYRQQLGGFHSETQLLEVYGVKEETMLAIWDFFEFDPQIFKKIGINSGSVEDIAGHPYISYGEAKVLTAYRKQHGRFNSADDLLKIKIFKPAWVHKINPYLDFD